MSEYLKPPAFVNESEEAQWWFDNRDRLAEDFQRAEDEGKLTRGTLERHGITPTTTIRLDPADISKARTLAERKGIRYQTYLKTLIHEALEREEKTAS
jgi:predicted DNA binding CopG/RHH family protein